MGIGQSEFWKSLFSPKGRADRGRFWMVTILTWLVLASESAFYAIMGPSTEFGMLVIAATLGGILVSLFNSVRRLHDMGLGGWWMLMAAVVDTPLALMAEPTLWPEPVVTFGAMLQIAFAIACLLVLGCWPGQKGPNRFGPPPV